MTLDELRAELAALDRRLLGLVAERQRLVTEIGRTKQATGGATRDFRQERVVLQRARAAASAEGLPEELAEAILLKLIESSLAAQEQDLVAATGEGTGKRAIVIGGFGRLGQWLVRFLGSQGYRVEVADPAVPATDALHHPDWRQVELDHDVVVLATPLAATARILHELAEKPPPGLVFDVASLKSPLRDGLLALSAAGARVTSIHPLFGPQTAMLSGRHVVFVDVGHREATEEAKALFGATMAARIDMDLESHDRLMAYVLGLSHALNIAFFTALSESGEAAPRLAEISSTTFDAQLDVARRVAEENPDLYFEIQSLNDYGTESLSALLLAVERLRSVVRAGDRDGFVALMEQGRRYLRSRRDEGAPP